MQIQPDKIRMGLDNPVQHSQGIFRQILKAMSEPGRMVQISQRLEPPKTLNIASYAIALTLFDDDTHIAFGSGIEDEETLSSLLFYCSSVIVKNISRAEFLICDESAIPDLDSLNAGSEAYPDQSCTLIIQCKSLHLGYPVVATGPGIASKRSIYSTGFNARLLEQRRQFQQQFPLGIDLILTSGDEFLAIPRTTTLKTEINEMYVAVKGGEKAIAAAHGLLAEKRRGDHRQFALSVRQIEQQLPYAVDRVMTEGSLYDPQLASLALKQAAGDLIEAIFLLRAFRTTLPRFASSLPVDTEDMRIERRISATFKDIPGGQILGPTFDYSHRLLDFDLLDEDCWDDEESQTHNDAEQTDDDTEINYPQVLNLIADEGLIENSQSNNTETDFDVTREPLNYPATRSARLQSLARGDEGFLLALGYSTQRGYGRNHPFAGEIRIGEVTLSILPNELGFEIDIGTITLTECQMVNQFQGSSTEKPCFTRGYGLAFGHNERKAMSMALVDRALRGAELNENYDSPAQDEEFVLAHADNIESVGFVSHLKLPHYVDFQSELELLRKIRRQYDAENNQSSVESVA